jgi:hypothetical protein
MACTSGRFSWQHRVANNTAPALQAYRSLAKHQRPVTKRASAASKELAYRDADQVLLLTHSLVIVGVVAPQDKPDDGSLPGTIEETSILPEPFLQRQKRQ